MPSSPKKREYKPGFRRTAYGQLSDNQIAFVETHWGTIALLSHPWNEDDELARINVGPNVEVHLPPGKRKIGLSHLRVSEIEQMREFFNLAFDLALPVAAERDRRSDAAEADGDDSVYRGYRRAPRMVVREGPLAKHMQGVLFGSPAVSGSSGDADSDSGGAGGSGTRVAAAEPVQDLSEDDASETDEP